MPSTEGPDDAPAAGGVKALTGALRILRLLAESPAPLSASALAEQAEVHVSTVSRVLAALRAEGYVRKPEYRSFAVDIGVLALSGNLRRHLPFMAWGRQAVEQLLQQRPQHFATLTGIWDDQLVYFVQAGRERGCEELVFGGFPLHLSSPALLLLSALPLKEGRRILRSSRRRHGWDRPTRRVPDDEDDCLATARNMVQNRALALVDWQGVDRFSVAVRIADGDHLPLALTLAGRGAQAEADDALAVVQVIAADPHGGLKSAGRAG